MKKNKRPKIKDWKETKSTDLVSNDGKLFIVHFDKIFNNKKYGIYNRFIIKKRSYENRLDVISKYINYFMNVYDTDNELASAYFKIKYAIDKKKIFTAENPGALISMIYEIMFTDTMQQKIIQMTEDNYTEDIESGNEEAYKTNDKKYLESLEFKNDHIKILLEISFGMKCISMLLFHYVGINVMKIKKGENFIYNFYKPLFDIFSKDVNIYNKLYIYCKTKISDSSIKHHVIFDQREILGIDLYTVIEQFVIEVLISENMVKYQFNQNIIGFNKVIVKKQLIYFIKEAYSKTLTELTNTKNAEGLSGIDKMEMNLKKIDEGSLIMAELNVDLGIEYLKEQFDVPITEEEIQYYRQYHYPSKIQVRLVRSYFSKYFAGYRDLNLLDRRQYLTLLILLKKKLMIESGSDSGPDSCILPFILTGNLVDKVNTRLIRNIRFINKIQEDYMYQDLCKNKYKLLLSIDPEYIVSLLSTLINTRFTYVSYEHPELLGKEIEYSEDKISDELLFFLKNL